MQEIKNVQGSMSIVNETEFNIDTVYIRRNISKIIEDSQELWEYDEIQYSYQEWLEIQENKILDLQKENQLLKEELTQIKTSITSLMATTLKEK